MVNFNKYIRLVPLSLYDQTYKSDYSLQNFAGNNDRIVLIFDVDFCLYRDSRAKIAEKNHNQKWEEELKNEVQANGGIFKNFKQLKEKFKSSRSGVQNYYGKGIDYVKANDFTEVDKYIEVNFELIKELDSLHKKVEMYCFTNGFPEKASKILQKLQIEDFFGKVFCSIDGSEGFTQWLTKPDEDAYRFIKKYLAIDHRTKVVFFDDLLENIRVAESKEFNWKTYLVSDENDIIKSIQKFKKDYGISDNNPEKSLLSKLPNPITYQ